MRNEIPQHTKFPVSLRSSFFHLVLILTFPFLLKGLERIQKQTGEGLATHSPAFPCVKPHSQSGGGGGGKEIITITTDILEKPPEFSKGERRDVKTYIFRKPRLTWSRCQSHGHPARELESQETNTTHLLPIHEFSQPSFFSWKQTPISMSLLTFQCPAQ